ncbi:hypothetical protein ACGFIV_00950 [Sphaerisporangium sp. NPDC049003]|uniref:hypothetical protein n=1 Tax=Sphaerisporangium sp. NPDC049003 TaxID=3364517 RepID=UPI003712601D
MKIEIDAAAVRRQFYLMFHDIDAAGAEVAAEWAGHVQTHAVDHVAVDTGFLGAHIDKRVSKARMSAQVGVFDKDGYYGTFIEKGTDSITADPFLEPAFDDGNDRLEEITRRAIDRHLPG